MSNHRNRNSHTSHRDWFPNKINGIVSKPFSVRPQTFSDSRLKSIDKGIPLGLFRQNRKLIGIYVNFDGFTDSAFSAHIALGPDQGITEGELVID